MDSHNYNASHSFDNINFDNLKFGEVLSAPLVTKWKEHPEGTYAIIKKTPTQSKFGPSYILDLRSTKREPSRIYTPKYITEYLNNNHPRFIKLIKDGDTNKAQFSD